MAIPSPRTSANSFTPEQIDDLRTQLAAFPGPIRERGRAYAHTGRVGRLALAPEAISARVTGTYAYDVRWTWNASGWRHQCTCPMAQQCKHAYATGAQLLGPLLPDEPETERSTTALFTGRSSWERSAAVRELLRERPGTTVHLHLPPFQEILEEPDPDLLLWRLAQALPAATAGWIPRGLEPFRDRPDLEARFVERNREKLAARIAAWSTPAAPAGAVAAPARSLRFVFDFRPTAGREPALVIEGRVTTPRMSDEVRKAAQLHLLSAEAGRKAGLLSEEHVELLEAYLANLASSWNDTNGRIVTTTTIRRLLEVGGGSPAVAWSADLDPALAARFAITPGAPVGLSTRAVHIVPCIEPRGDGFALDLEARWPDGRRRALRDAHLVRGGEAGGRNAPSLLFCENDAHVVAGQPPADLADDLRELGGLPLDAGRHAPLLADLTQRFPTFRESLAPHARLLETRPVVALDVRDDWLVIRMFAAPADATWVPGEPREPGMSLHEFATDRRWTAVPEDAVPEPGAAPAPAALALLDPAPLAGAIEWLGHTAATARGRAWALRMTARNLAAFDDAWQGRPKNARWYSTPGARRLLDEPRRVYPSLSVKSSGVDWFTVTATWESEDLVLSTEDLALLRRGTERYVRLSTGWARRDTGEAIEKVAGVLADLGLEAGTGEQRVSLWQLAHARPESLGALAEYGGDGGGEAAEAIADLRRRVSEFTGLPRATVPAGFHGELRPYQQDGVDFLAFASTMDLGAVLADDMGLGKTVQALAWLLWLRERAAAGPTGAPLGPTLVVCPASVVHNWIRETERFAPGLRAVRLTGADRRAALRTAIATGADLLVTNFALLRLDRVELQKTRFGAVILDEAQNIKNPNTAVSRAARELNARHRLALTGTPLENRALDLWSILAFASPGFLGSRRAFTARYDGADAGPHARRLLAAKLRPVLLRRMKKEVAKELPPRTEERLDCELLPIQKKLYAEQLARGRAVLAALMSGDKRALDQNRFEILAILTRMRQICCHPALVGAPAAAPSGKFDALWEVLEPLLAEGHKVLLFSQFVECLKLLAREMKRRDMPTHMLTGQTQEKSREEVVARFNDDPRAAVFLISLKAGGTGLNLTSASHVVLFDPWWNPAVEAQAIDRTHRIGQTRKVTAFRLFTRGTIEEKIAELQQRKASLAREILGEDGFARSLTREDLEWLLEPA